MFSGEVLESVLALGQEDFQNPRLFVLFFSSLGILGKVLGCRRGACYLLGEVIGFLGEVLVSRRIFCL